MALLDGDLRTPPVEKFPSDPTASRGTPFELSGDSATFAPRYMPDTFRRTKERDINRKDAFCHGENVTDQGSKNWEVHASGRLLTREIKFFDRIVEDGNEVLLTSASWSGEVVVEAVELEGPTAWDPQQNQYQWTYTIDLISTGRDEPGETNNNGIVSTGDN